MSSEFLKDRIGSGSPDRWAGLAIVVLNEFLNPPDQFIGTHGLDLRLFIDSKNNAVIWRVEAQFHSRFGKRNQHIQEYAA